MKPIDANDLTLWNFRVIEYDKLCHDGPTLGMGEAYYVERGDEVLLQVWSSNPDFLVLGNDINNLPVQLDGFEADLKKGIRPEWAEGLTDDEILTNIQMMRRAPEGGVIHEKKILQTWGEA